MSRNALVFGFGLAVALVAGWVGVSARCSTCRNSSLSSFATRRTRRNLASPIAVNAMRFARTELSPEFPPWRNVRSCHSERIGESKAEATLVNNYIKPGHETPWLVYARQPANVWFSHAIHVKRGGLACTECHSTYGESDQVRVYQLNRISGYSRDIWGHSISRLRRAPHEGMKMSDCEDCHRRHNVEVGCLGCHE